MRTRVTIGVIAPDQEAIRLGRVSAAPTLVLAR
jgi:hypothetical protein